MDRPCVGVHYPRSVGEFQAWFRTDADCLDYLEWLRWPNGFVCPHCGHAGGWWLADERCPALPTRSDSIRGMARSPKRRKRAPDPPDLPTELDPAPARLESRARWECVHAGGDVEVGAQLAGVDIRESDWADADLAGRHLSGLHCRDVRFDRCDLSGAVLDAATLTRVLFTDCRLTGVVLNGATLQDVHVRGGRADVAYLRMVKSCSSKTVHSERWTATRPRWRTRLFSVATARRELPGLPPDRRRPARLELGRPAR